MPCLYEAEEPGVSPGVGFINLQISETGTDNVS
jgi:hypothetical protein